MSDIVFVGNGRCYHTLDWYRDAKTICYPNKVFLATDLIESEGHIKIVKADDNIINLYNIDKLLLRKQSRLGNIWRNIVKGFFSPLQAVRLIKIAKNNSIRIFHAHSTYYMFLCWLARVPFIATPQGSEILIRPNKSGIYRHFLIKSLLAAKSITVDSVHMQNKIIQLCGKKAAIIQNGIDTKAIMRFAANSIERKNIISIRGFHPLYRIDEILNARATSLKKPPLLFVYASWEEGYRAKVAKKYEKGDVDLGRIAQKTKYYELLFSSLLAISIPESDSSPRGVYEAIFCGCCVAITKSNWIDALPSCMRARLFIVSLEDALWLDKAIDYAEVIAKEPYRPSELALETYDQKKSMEIIVSRLY